MEWRDIKSAPRDGTAFLAWDKFHKKIVLCHWGCKPKDIPSWLLANDMLWDYDHSDDCFPEYWMPLPAAPK